jgi:hypothetical protein
MDTELAELQNRVDRTRLTIEALKLEAVAGTLQKASYNALRESWYADAEYVDPRLWHTDDYGNPLHGWMPGGNIHDREDGIDRPFFETEDELNAIRARARWICGANGIGVGILEKLTNYVIGTGFTFKFLPDELGMEGLAETCQKWVDLFARQNRWHGDADREGFARSRRDGDTFYALYAMPDGTTQLRFIEPEQIVEPPESLKPDLDERYADGNPTSWKFGVHTSESDHQRVFGYFVQWSQSPADYEYLPADMVVHQKVNVDRNIKRGLSDFYPVFDPIDEAHRLRKNTSEGSITQAAIAYIVEAAEGVTRDTAQAATFARADYTGTVRTSQSQRSYTVKKIQPNTVLTTPHGQQYKPGPLGAERAPNFIEVLQSDLRWVGQRWDMPEYMISGDASNANYASTMVAESPWVKACVAKQHAMKSVFEEIMWRVIGNAIKSGAFEPFGFWKMDATALEQMRRKLTLDIEPPTVEVREKTAETDRNEKLHKAKVISLKTWSAREDVDFDDEQEQIKTEPQPVDPMVAALGLSPQQPGQPFGQQPPQNAPQPPQQPPSPLNMARESAHDRLSRAAAILWEGYPG